MKLIPLLIFILIFFILSCHTKNGKDYPLPVQTMKLVMWDLMKADGWYTATSLRDSTAKFRKENIRLYEQVFLIHGITRDEFFTSYKYYESHPVSLKILVDSLDDFSSREKDRVIVNHGQAK